MSHILFILINLGASVFIGVFIGIIYRLAKSLALTPLANSILKNSKEKEVLTEVMVKARILKKYPNAFDFEKNFPKVIGIVAVIVFISGLVVQYSGYDFNKFFEQKSRLNMQEMKVYKDKSDRFSFMYPTDYKLESTANGGTIYSEVHRKFKTEDPQKYNEIPYLGISFEVVAELPKSMPGGPEMKFDEKRVNGKTVYFGEVIPSGMPNKHFFIALNKGFLDISIEPYFDQETDDARLKDISMELSRVVDDIVFTTEVK